MPPVPTLNPQWFCDQPPVTSFTILLLSTLVNAPVSRFPGNMLFTEPIPGATRLYVTLSSRSHSARTLNRVLALRPVSTRVTRFLRSCSGVTSRESLEVHRLPGD